MSTLFDVCSLVSVVGIWPRFVEPRLLLSTELKWQLAPKHAHLDGLVIVHLSDLHFNAHTPSRFLEKICRKLQHTQPDLILFTGDFLCYASLEQRERLQEFLNHFQAPLGSFCVLGNHDYAHYVSLDENSVYVPAKPLSPLRGITKGVRGVLKRRRPYQISEAVYTIPKHQDLLQLLEKTPLQLLDNRTVTLPIGLNICGLGDLSLGESNPSCAFKNYASPFPGIVLAHNPDALPSLLPFPGDWILMGHTHGEQIHFPWPLRTFSRALTRLENGAYTRGLYHVHGKSVYINRGLGTPKSFRLFSPPEFCTIRARKK